MVQKTASRNPFTVVLFCVIIFVVGCTYLLFRNYQLRKAAVDWEVAFNRISQMDPDEFKAIGPLHRARLAKPPAEDATDLLEPIPVLIRIMGNGDLIVGESNRQNVKGLERLLESVVANFDDSIQLSVVISAENQLDFPKLIDILAVCERLRITDVKLSKYSDIRQESNLDDPIVRPEPIESPSEMLMVTPHKNDQPKEDTAYRGRLSIESAARKHRWAPTQQNDTFGAPLVVANGRAFIVIKFSFDPHVPLPSIPRPDNKADNPFAEVDKQRMEWKRTFGQLLPVLRVEEDSTEYKPINRNARVTYDGSEEVTGSETLFPSGGEAVFEVPESSNVFFLHVSGFPAIRLDRTVGQIK
jgi:biopolymer transport protein ExbD